MNTAVLLGVLLSENLLVSLMLFFLRKVELD